MLEADHSFNAFFIQSTFEFLERLVVRIEWIVPDCGIVNDNVT
jgi:hypothetical protein